ncbi:PKD domain-containing protein [Sanguibacter suaedae]|uniref:PKD domain-containing protein n=1 Tax=Sanguibacter suaedae TaxID=2795737 RepID=A0A934M9L5_9MICO|nr:PKD domain-containing protein [Sanguibacter suaedae]MBI9114715.1 PKD domain-containing protein [Sanguibacter suaedae]
MSLATCLTEAGAIPVTVTEVDFRSLPLTASPVQVQPPTLVSLVNIATITYTDNTPQILDTTILGQPVRVRATPASFTWDFGDGSTPLVTTDPGNPYPDHTVARTYTTTGTYTITLTTTWTGEYSLDAGTTYQPIPGTATTTTTTDPLTIEERRTLLTDD